MTWKPRIIIAGGVLIACIVLTALGFNHFVQAIGYMSAGYLFGTVPPTKTW